VFIRESKKSDFFITGFRFSDPVKPVFSEFSVFRIICTQTFKKFDNRVSNWPDLLPVGLHKLSHIPWKTQKRRIKQFSFRMDAMILFGNNTHFHDTEVCNTFEMPKEVFLTNIFHQLFPILQDSASLSLGSPETLPL
jgi:hypothetical protein